MSPAYSKAPRESKEKRIFLVNGKKYSLNEILWMRRFARRKTQADGLKNITQGVQNDKK